jgi:hypothetical protein
MAAAEPSTTPVRNPSGRMSRQTPGVTPVLDTAAARP